MARHDRYTLICHVCGGHIDNRRIVTKRPLCIVCRMALNKIMKRLKPHLIADIDIAK